MIEKELFIKSLVDAGRMNKSYIDDTTASLFYDRFYEVSYTQLEKALNSILKNGDPIIYKTLYYWLNYYAPRKKENEDKEKEKVFNCNENCKLCNKDVICKKMYDVMLPIIPKLLSGNLKIEEIKPTLHEMFPTAGFDKKNGKCIGVIRDENNEYISVYQYD